MEADTVGLGMDTAQNIKSIPLHVLLGKPIVHVILGSIQESVLCSLSREQHHIHGP